MATQVMIDIETMGTGNNAAILSIGAVKFDLSLRDVSHDCIIDRFYAPVDLKSSQAHGGKVDADTVIWWLARERDEARVEMLGEQRIDLASVLEGFASWFGDDSLPVWGNGATFDNVIVRSAYDSIGMACPWKFYDDRCHRTLKNLAPGLNPPRLGVHHNALADAEYQVHQLLMVVKHLGLIL